jgi:hypothetical protein
MKETEVKPILRETFGLGHAGEIAYQTLVSGVSCESNEQDGRKCQKTATRTVDFDVFSNYEFISVCGDEHAARVIKRVIEESKAQGLANPGFGKNGWGRA